MRRTSLCCLFLSLPALLPTALAAQCSGTWDAWLSGSGPYGTVNDMITWDPDGAGPAQTVVVAVGDFQAASGVTVNNIATFEVATRTWGGVGAGTNGRVNAVLALPNGNLVIGGAFTNAGGVACNNLAEWNGSSWSAFAGGTNHEVFALTLLPNADLLVGGAFTMAGTVPCNRIARWNWSSWSSYGTGMDGNVTCLATWPNGTFVVGGSFTTAGGTAACGVSRWNGAYWVSYGGCGYELVGSSDVAALPNGDFLTVQGGVIKQWSLALLTWVTLTPQVAATVGAIRLLPNGHVVATGKSGPTIPEDVALWEWDGVAWTAATYVGGRFMPQCVTEVPGIGFTIGGSARTGFAAHTSTSLWNGAQWTPMGNGFDGPITSVLELSNGDVLVSGNFNACGSRAGLNGMALWNGQAWTPMGALPGGAKCLAQLRNGDVLAGAVSSSQCVLRWNGTTWSSFGSFGGDVTRIVEAPDGDIFIGGYMPNSGYPSSVSRLHGSTWSPVAPYSGSYPVSLTVLGNSVVYGLGNSVSRWNGSGWTVLGTCDNVIRALQALPNGDLIAGGAFNTINSVNLRNMARWNGTAWLPLGPGLNSTVNTLGMLADGDLVASGYFTAAVGGGGGAHVARWNGTSWTDLAGFDVQATRIVSRKNGELLLQGPFSPMGSGSLSYAHRWTPGCPATSTPNGSVCSGSSGPNHLVAGSLAWTGASIHLQASGLPQNGLCALVSGLQSAAIPLSTLLPQGRPGCDLLVTSDLGVQLGVPTAGALDFAFAIANVPALTGVMFRQQVLTMEFGPQGSIVDLTGTNAITHTIGTL